MNYISVWLCGYQSPGQHLDNECQHNYCAIMSMILVPASRSESPIGESNGGILGF
uniref:Uncharacterized protein n=1 Tax=Arion vulgaris TaxID=1028688 RepID=A0A0B7C265_9EUPU